MGWDQPFSVVPVTDYTTASPQRIGVKMVRRGQEDVDFEVTVQRDAEGRIMEIGLWNTRPERMNDR